MIEYGRISFAETKENDYLVPFEPFHRGEPGALSEIIAVSFCHPGKHGQHQQ